MAVVPGRQDPLERRRAASSRVAAVTDAVEGLLEGLTVQERRAADPDGLLSAAVRALLGVAQRFERGELIVSVGPEHAFSVRIRDDGAGPKVELVSVLINGVSKPPAPAPEPGVPKPRSSAEEPSPAFRGPPPEVAAELADLLRGREVTKW